MLQIYTAETAPGQNAYPLRLLLFIIISIKSCTVCRGYITLQMHHSRDHTATPRASTAISIIGTNSAAKASCPKIKTIRPTWRNASIGVLRRNLIPHILRLGGGVIFRRIHRTCLTGQQGQAEQQGQGQRSELFQHGNHPFFIDMNLL